MRRESLIHFLGAMSSVSQIPVAVFKNDKLLFFTEQGSAVSSLKIKIYYCFINFREDNIIFDGVFMLSKIRTPEGYEIISGPSITSYSAKERYADAMHSIGYYPAKKELDYLADYYNFSRLCTYPKMNQFMEAIALATGADYKVAPEIEIKQNNAAGHEMVENYEISWSNYNLNIVEKMKNIIRTGNVEAMDEFFKTENHAPYGKLATDNLRHFKNSMMVQIYIDRCAAREGGLDEDLCLRLAEMYSQQCEDAKSIEELGRISRNLRMDFCKRVQDVRKITTDSKTVNDAIIYIHENRMEKLNAGIIAEELKISPEYLRMEFKRRTGKSIVDFIAEEKIETAKELLRFSNQSSLKIAEYLSFSSQAYFQTVFKKYTGMTPGEYRKNSRN